MADDVKIKVELSSFKWHQVLTELESYSHVYGRVDDPHSPLICRGLLVEISNKLSDIPVIFRWGEPEPSKSDLPKEETKPIEKKSWKNMPWYKRWWRK